MSDEGLFDRDVSRREAMKTAMKGAAYAAPVVFATAIPVGVAAASSDGCAAKIKAIFTVARTAEQLAITFYSNGVKNAAQLGFTPTQLGQIQAALVEEQLHQQLFTAQGGDSLADTFSFPQGAKTFTDLQTFIDTQQMLEGVFDSAFLAAVREFCEIGQPRLAQIASQIACIESEHRALGRAIAGLEPADNWTYAPVLVSFVADAPAAVTAAGFLSPVPGNSYQYTPVDTSTPGILYKDGPFSQRA
ncbi:MAG: ferritin-like domain-containing protein [Chloroflexota bacterium]|nr:ferritin-like domain-containing protein [Chloroflexota bacterium]